jgi:putative ABC transport system permease protein
MRGVGENYLVVRNWPLADGRFFSPREINSAAKVCVIGETLVEKLFQATNPIDQTIRVKNIPFRVIGVLAAKGANMVGEDQDNVLLMPYTTAQKRVQGTSFESVDAIMVSARSSEQMTQAAHEIERLLTDRHRLAEHDEPDFQVRNMTEFANVFSIITGTMTLLLSAIAGISLLVGGVGVMNIMLVSVTERTREIGIRLAVGARGRDIMRQFLVESVLLSSFGGVVGFLLGMAASFGVTKLINSLSSGSAWPVVISFPAAIAAMVFSAAVGIFFGFYPARRASRLDPIEALRYE